MKQQVLCTGSLSVREEAKDARAIIVRYINGIYQQFAFFGINLSAIHKKIGYTYFQTKTAEMTLKIDQGHCNGTVQYPRPHILLLVCRNHGSILYRFWDI